MKIYNNLPIVGTAVGRDRNNLFFRWSQRSGEFVEVCYVCTAAGGFEEGVE